MYVLFSGGKKRRRKKVNYTVTRFRINWHLGGFPYLFVTLFFSGRAIRGTSDINYPPRGMVCTGGGGGGTGWRSPREGPLHRDTSRAQRTERLLTRWDRWGHFAGLKTHQPSFQWCLPASICWVEAINTFLWIFFLYCICFLIEHSFSSFFFSQKAACVVLHASVRQTE